MESKAPWWHKFMTKECIVAAVAGFVFGVWTMWYHMRDQLPELEPVPDPEVECHDTLVPVNSDIPTECPNAHQSMSSPWHDKVVCTCPTRPKKR